MNSFSNDWIEEQWWCTTDVSCTICSQPFSSCLFKIHKYLLHPDTWGTYLHHHRLHHTHQTSSLSWSSNPCHDTHVMIFNITVLIVTIMVAVNLQIYYANLSRHVCFIDISIISVLWCHHRHCHHYKNYKKPFGLDTVLSLHSTNVDIDISYQCHTQTHHLFLPWITKTHLPV